MSNVLGCISILLFMLFTWTNTQDSATILCDSYKDCTSCINEDQCQFVIWESTERDVSAKRICVDIKLDDEGVRKLGPLGNQKNDTHWSMKSFHNVTKCHIHHQRKAAEHIKKLGMYN